MEKVANDKTPSAENLIRSAHTQLLRAQQILNREIAAYPTPIAGCDAQYNHLLAERRRLRTVLKAMDEEISIVTSREPREPI